MTIGARVPTITLTPSLRPPLSLSLSPPGWNERVDYEPGTGSKQLFPKMHLETCGGPLSSVRTTVELQTSHIGKGCDRETYSEKSLQKLCGWFCRDISVVPVNARDPARVTRMRRLRFRGGGGIMYSG